MRPEMKTVWLMLMTLVLGVIARSKDPTISSTEAGGKPQGHLLHHHSVPGGLQGPGLDTRWMLHVRQEDLVPGLQLQAVGHEVHALRGVPGEDDLFGAAPRNRATLFRTSSRRVPKVL